MQCSPVKMLQCALHSPLLWQEFLQDAAWRPEGCCQAARGLLPVQAQTRSWSSAHCNARLFQLGSSPSPAGTMHLHGQACWCASLCQHSEPLNAVAFCLMGMSIGVHQQQPFAVGDRPAKFMPARRCLCDGLLSPWWLYDNDCCYAAAAVLQEMAFLQQAEERRQSAAGREFPVAARRTAPYSRNRLPRRR